MVGIQQNVKIVETKKNKKKWKEFIEKIGKIIVLLTI